MMFKLFDTMENVHMQIQKKRRKNNSNGQQQENNYYGNKRNNGWNQNQGNNGWGQQNLGLGDVLPQLGFNAAMAIFANQSLWGNDLKGYDWVQKQKKMQDYEMVSANQASKFGFSDIADVLNKQITMMEPSPAEKRLKQLKLQGKTFYDDRFPPNNISLCGEYGSLPEWKSISWKKISDILPKALIFKDKVQPADIKQGQLGDCYFLAGLAALAERPDRIFSLFLLKQTNSVKYYSVKMLYKGKWMTIDMDQYIPTLYNEPAFSKSVGNELWVMLLQKAWAKMYTSFKRIEAGYPQQALHDLTGAPIKNIYMKQADFNKEVEWNYLMMASQKQYSMVASSRPGSDRNKSETGIVLGHAYTFLNATVLNFNGRSQRIVQLRNPWGKGESKGKWSDNDQNWNLVSPQQKKRIGYTGKSDDGIFFMTYDAFIQEFRSLTVAEINDNASYIYKSMKDRYNEGVYFKIEIVQPGRYSFQVDKTPQRSFTDSIQKTYSYPEARFQLGEIKGSSCKKLQGIISSRRTLYRSYDLTPGIYIAFVRINFNPTFEKDFEVNLAVYAQYVCDIEVAPRNLVIQFTGNPNVKWNPSEHISKSDWNDLGNSSYQHGDSGWGNGGNGGNNNGWNNHNNNNNNNGWGNDNNGGNNNGKNDGWGSYFNKPEPPKPENDGWGSYFNKPQPPKPADDGWGSYFDKPNPNNNNNGWGHQQNNNNKKNNNDGWGNYFDEGEKGNKKKKGHEEHNNGWGKGNNGW